MGRSVDSNNSRLQTYIDGLDLLLGGGINQDGKDSPCMLLEGPPGSGKTTLAFQIAVNIAHEHKGIAVVFSIEESPNSLRKKAENFGWLQQQNKPVLLLSGTSRDIERAAISKGGVVFLLSASPDDFVTMTESVAFNIHQIRREISTKPIKCIVLDSISAVEEKILREDFFVLRSECAENSPLAIFVNEQLLESEPFGLREYISDIVIRLGNRYRTERKDYLERYIEIVKVRNQFHYRGKHPFSIVNSQRQFINQIGNEKKTSGGVHVYPSMATRLASQFKPPSPREHKRHCFDIPVLDSLLFTNGADQKKQGVAQGSTTLLIGERGTKKLPLALHFLAAGIQKEEKCLLISLKDDDIAIRAISQGYGELSSLFSKEEYLLIEHIRPSYFTPGRFLDKVATWIKDSKNRHNDIKRVVFNSFAQIRLRFPLLEAEPMFIPTLIDLLKTEGCTSLFIDIIEDPEKMVWELKSPILDLADYVIATQHLPFLGRDHTVLSVRRSREGNHNSDPTDVRKEGNQLVIDEHAFDAITGVLKKDPKPAESSLKLFYENRPGKEFNDELKKDFKEKYGETVHATSFSRVDSSTEFSRIKRYWIESPSSIVRVTSLDEHWVKYASHQEMLWPIDKNWIDTNDFLSGALEPAKINGKLYAIPDHLNLGFFCYRKDLFDNLFKCKQLPKDFGQLIKLIEPHIGELKEKGLWGFTFDMETEETLVCTFLEFLFNTSTPKGRAGSILLNINNEEKCHSPILFDDDIQEAILEVLKTMRDLVVKEIMPYPCTLEHCKDSIFSRQWYSNIQAVCHDLWHPPDKQGRVRTQKQYKDGRFGVMEFPVIKGNEAYTQKGTDHYSCSGSWYLGVLKQSVRPRLGYHLINDITSVYHNYRRYELGSGIPTRRSFYKFHGHENVKSIEGLTYNDIENAFEKKQECRRKIFHREIFCSNNIKLYRSIRTPMADILLKVLNGEITPEFAAQEMVAT